MLTYAVKATVAEKQLLLLWYYFSHKSKFEGHRAENKLIRWDKQGCKVRDENGDIVKLKRPYMMYILSKAFKMFCEQHPKAKICRSTFCNSIPGYVVLRANKAADMCPCTYQENMPWMSKIIRGCIRCDKVNRWKTWILSFSCFHQTVTGSLTCRKKRKSENCTSSISLWIKWELSLCASRSNAKQTLGLYFLHFIYSNSSFQRYQGQSFEKETIYHCIRLCHNKYAVSKFLDIIFDEFSKSQPDLIINEWFFHSDGPA